MHFSLDPASLSLPSKLTPHPQCVTKALLNNMCCPQGQTNNMDNRVRCYVWTTQLCLACSVHTDNTAAAATATLLPSTLSFYTEFDFDNDNQ